jgi:hypothetical protein
MQQLTYVKKRALEWREAPEPTLQLAARGDFLTCVRNCKHE